MNDSNPIEVHTSDRQTFKRCRRKWDWKSRMRQNLVTENEAEKSAPWIGTGVHWALEDLHGWQRFPSAVAAFQAYVAAFKRMELPDTWEDDQELAGRILQYYETFWLPKHPEPYETLVVDGDPQVEVEVHVDITHLLPKGLRQDLGRPVVYVMTFDRVVIDRHDRILGLDYKTAKQFASGVLALDSQVGAYHWGLNVFYDDHDDEGIIWQQHVKAAPEPPRLVKGKKKDTWEVSKDKRQHTTYAMYRAALIEHYGVIPQTHIETLNEFASKESVEGDQFIRRDVLRRNQEQVEAEQAKIALEVADMLSSGLPIYNNPTRDCSWDCEFQAACLMADDGSDVADYLATNYVQWEGYKDDWRERIVYPD